MYTQKSQCRVSGRAITEIPGTPALHLQKMHVHLSIGLGRRMQIFCKLLLAAALTAYAANAADANSIEAIPNPSSTGKPNMYGKKLWISSIAAIGIAGAMDVQSSWGKHELNPVLSGTNGSIGARGALIKLGVQGGIVGLECLVLHRRPTRQMFRAFSIINFGDAAATGAIAAHNYTILRR